MKGKDRSILQRMRRTKPMCTCTVHTLLYTSIQQHTSIRFAHTNGTLLLRGFISVCGSGTAELHKINLLADLAVDCSPTSYFETSYVFMYCTSYLACTSIILHVCICTSMRERARAGESGREHDTRVNACHIWDVRCVRSGSDLL